MSKNNYLVFKPADEPSYSIWIGYESKQAVAEAYFNRQSTNDVIEIYTLDVPVTFSAEKAIKIIQHDRLA